jgi:mRNA-degrading endonuclease RelE of RelBE toxin-antitoxin system
VGNDSEFDLIYAPIAKEHLRAIDRKYYTLIRSEVDTQLRHEPDVRTRNRKPLKRPIIFRATWEIRFGPENRFRVLYRVDRAAKQVIVLAIGEKMGARLLVGGEEIKL